MSRFLPYEIAMLREGKLSNVPFKGENQSMAPSSAADKGAILEFIPMHIAKKTPIITFMAMLDRIDDNFRHEFSSNQAYGRTDPYYIWKGHQRQISVSWNVLSTSKEMALRNLNNINWLISSMYPAYQDTVSATSIAATPLFRVKYSNLITSMVNKEGILCTIQGFSIKPEMKAGVISLDFANSDADKKILKEANFKLQSDHVLVPKEFNIGCTLQVVHEHALGWDSTTGEWRGRAQASGFPYGFGVLKEAADPNASGGSTAASSADTKAKPAAAGGDSKVDSREAARAQRKINS